MTNSHENKKLLKENPINGEALIKRITELEDALRESEEKYDSLFHHSLFPMSLLDADTGEVIAFNKMLHEIHGYSFEEFEKLSGADLEIDATPGEITKRMNRTIEEGALIYDTKHRTKNGDTIELLVSSVAAKIGKKYLIHNISADVTELKKAQESKQKSENRFRQLAEYIPDALFLHDMEGKIIDANQVACKTLGYTKEELIGLYIQDIDLKYNSEDDLNRFKSMATAQPITIESIQKRKDGSVFSAEIRLLKIDFDDQQLMLALVHNIEKRKYAEQERKKLEAQLAYSQKIQAIGTLAGGIAHNFNNLLMGIQGNISLMLFDKNPENPDYPKLANVQQLIENGAKLTNQLLGYAREGRYDSRIINLNDIIRETAGTFGAAKKEISLHYQLDDDLLHIRADRGQIEQTLLNLYVNAAEAMPNGGKLFMKTANTSNKDMKSKSYTPKAGKYVLLTIEDTGIGIDKETIDRIFDPFFTTKGLAKGTGLGLASVYGIIKGHNGYIDVDSEKDRGTIFSIYLPAIEGVTESETDTHDSFIMGKETIFLIDDEELILEAGEKMLQNMGYKVLVSKRGREAVDLFESKKDSIDMVLLDMVMPDMGGGETYDRLKSIDPDVKVLLSSGYGLDGEAREILDRGCNGFIQKPFKMKQLSLKIREVLSG